MNIGVAIMEHASNGDTEIFINNREITKTELMMLKMELTKEEGQNRVIGNIWNKKRARLACAVLSLPFHSTTSSAVEPTDEPIYNPKMLTSFFSSGNEKCGRHYHLQNKHGLSTKSVHCRRAKESSS
ncbi:Extra-large guanine nucleotide-binding protein 2 [Raphanus sativus]|nr:Extra-large guanine nucleotide-binding protein 2 [Raphanus sativus]